MRLVGMALLGMALNGCIYYENTGDCGGEDCGWDGWGSDFGDDSDDSDDPFDTGSADSDEPDPDPEPELTFYVDPPHVAQGESIIVSLRSEDGVDFTTVDGARFLGDIQIDAIMARGNEALLGIYVAEDAALGEVDLLIEFTDGTFEVAEAAMHILEAGASCPEDHGAPDDSGDPGTDTGDPGTDTGDPGTDTGGDACP